ncbi:MAG: AI-2E family transporter, partial [Deltaproteobacteria bacterium]|nr:AI-2E family transporter [Deltaproteobacteria bacterium]
KLKAEHFYTIISLSIAALLFYLFYKTLSPFFIPIVWAMSLSITFYPVYRLLLKFLKRPWAASLITLILIFALMIGPVAYIVTTLISETVQVYSTIEEESFSALIAKIQQRPLISKLYEKISSYKLLEGIYLKDAAVNGLKSLAKNIGENISELFKNAVVFAMNFVIMCLTIFYFLKDGELLIDYIKKLLPFSDAQGARLWLQVKEMVVSAIYGGVTVAIVQGVLGGVAFLIFGISSPVFWGAVMAVFSLVPFFGTFIIWGPAGIILILEGGYMKGIGLLLFGFLIIGMIDNILKPAIIGGRTKLHKLLIFFSVLGGINFFGLIGFILGPLIAALCLSLLEMYSVAEATEN